MDGVAAVHEAYRAYYHRLVGQLYGLTGDLPEAQDVVHEAYGRSSGRTGSWPASETVVRPTGRLGTCPGAGGYEKALPLASCAAPDVVAR